jgi:hypothetical protein
MTTAAQRDRWCKPTLPGHWHMLKARTLSGSEVYKVPIHTSLCLDAISYHSMSKEALLFLLPANTTEIICDQDCLWIKFLPWNLHTKWLWLPAFCSLSIRVVRSISVYRNPLVYELSVYEFLLLNFWNQLLCPVPLLSWHQSPNILKCAEHHDIP